jgi:hypothetical protein
MNHATIRSLTETAPFKRVWKNPILLCWVRDGLVVFSCLLLFAEDVPFFALAVMAMLWVVVVRACTRQGLKEIFPRGRPGFTKRGDGSGALNQPHDPWADPYVASNREQHSLNHYQQP